MLVVLEFRLLSDRGESYVTFYFLFFVQESLYMLTVRHIVDLCLLFCECIYDRDNGF